MQTKDWTLKEALEFVKQRRPVANPNAGFMIQLLKLEQKLHGKKTVKVSHAYHYCSSSSGSELAIFMLDSLSLPLSAGHHVQTA